MKQKYFSHSSFQITTDCGQILLIDPFLNNIPTSQVRSNETSAGYIIHTYGHDEHSCDSFKNDTNFTMGIDDTVKAVELTHPQTTLPTHYNTFPVIEVNPSEFANIIPPKESGTGNELR